jgi:hypothetical protein
MQVADCYIHVNYRSLDGPEFEQLSKRLFDEANRLARVVKRAQQVDFTFEQGTIIQRIVVIGVVLHIVSQYHDLRESVKEMVRDSETFSTQVIKTFHHVTNTTTANDIYRRTASKDLNRLRRIISNVDQIAYGHVPVSELSPLREQIIRDLAGLARANPDDTEIERLFHLLPKDRIPDFPKTPRDAVLMDVPRREPTEGPLGVRSVEERPRAPRRKFHRRFFI